MILFKTIEGLQNYLLQQTNDYQSIGFVPTMGALHQGHLSLITLSKKVNAITTCSIFINPTQFNDNKDFEKYPVTIENDILLLEKAGCDVLFLPSADEIYPNGTTLKEKYDLGYLETVLEGKFRPNHFQGVCQVVQRLLEIVKPTQLFLGQKDYQQWMVIRRLIALMEMPIELIIGPTLRENSGLAMSSRNVRLTEKDKIKSVAIYESLQFIKRNYTTSSLELLKHQAISNLLNTGFEKIDYVEICNAATLEPIKEGDRTTKAVILVAAFLNGVRLIDNMVLL